jgi:hypothetical protein
MKCATCEAAGQTSRVFEGEKRPRVQARAVKFFDEKGEYHVHDVTSVLTPFTCSNGHKWEHHSAVRCPTCGVTVDPAGTNEFGLPT